MADWLTWLIVGGMAFAVLLGVALGLFTRPPLGRGWCRRG